MTWNRGTLFREVPEKEDSIPISNTRTGPFVQADRGKLVSLYERISVSKRGGGGRRRKIERGPPQTQTIL